MRSGLATALTAVALVGLSSTPAQAAPPEETTFATLEQSKLSYNSQADELRLKLELQCQEGYTYTLGGSAFSQSTNPRYASYQSGGYANGTNTVSPKKAEGTCTGKVQRLTLPMPRTSTETAPAPEGKFTTVAYVQVSGGPCYDVLVGPNPYRTCQDVNFMQLTVK